VHVLKCSLLRHHERDLGKLSSEEQVRQMVRCTWHSGIDIAEERLSFDIAALVHCLVRYVHVSLANGLTFDASEVDGLLFGMVLDDFDNGETVHDKKMGVCTAPHSTRSR
jgi:hypothetical protein